MSKTFDLNIVSKTPLSSPLEVFNELPLSEKGSIRIAEGRSAVRAVLNSQPGPKLMVFAGPCSIHNPVEAIQYAHKLKELQDQVSDKMLLLMRTYFEKPRTIVGWKGLIYDPDLNGSYNFEKGIRLARKLMLDLIEVGVYPATEILDPIITQYISDVICWSAIGARTTESQTHRQLVSGLSMPTGFKNATNGDVQVAIEAVQSAGHKHAFLGVLKDGKTGVFRTSGNPDCHVVLRGGTSGPNFGSEWIAWTSEKLKKAGLDKNIIVDCSHANSDKQFKKQLDVLVDVGTQLQEGDDSICGVMIESNLFEGSQKVVDPIHLKPGVSITDGCLGWDDTREAILRLYDLL